MLRVTDLPQAGAAPPVTAGHLAVVALTPRRRWIWVAVRARIRRPLPPHAAVADQLDHLATLAAAYDIPRTDPKETPPWRT